MELLKSAGVAIDDATAAVVLVHGRGASAESMLRLAREIDAPGVAYVAPQAEGFSWYPHSFLAELEANEPGISIGIDAVLDAVRTLEAAGLSQESIALTGFSQGACLVCETAARNPRRYGGIVALSGGLIGSGEIPGASPPNDKTFNYDGSLRGTPVFIGCSDVDPHIPVERVRKTAEVFEGLGGDVTLRIYEGMGHTVNRDELTYIQGLLNSLASDRGGFSREE